MSQCNELAEAEQPERSRMSGADNEDLSEPTKKKQGGGDEIVQIESLTKRYGDFTALDDCCLGVARGEVFGLLGPNGAIEGTCICMRARGHAKKSYRLRALLVRKHFSSRVLAHVRTHTRTHACIIYS